MRKTISVICTALLLAFLPTNGHSDCTSGTWSFTTTSLNTTCGNVGIGTGTPGAKLDLSAGVTARGSDSDLLIGTTVPQIEFFGASKSVALNYYNNALNVYMNGPSWTQAMLITDGGNVGIGTATATQRLTVNGATLTSTLMFPDGSSQNTAYNPSSGLAVSGNVGLGTTPARNILTIGKAAGPSTLTIANSYLQLGNSEIGLNTYRFMTFGYAGGTVYPAAYVGYQETNSAGATNGDLVFGTRAATTDTAPGEIMRIGSNGNVGIGTTPDTANRLKIEGDLYVHGTINGTTVVGAVYQDIAEWVPANDGLGAGTVVVLDPESTNKVMASRKAYDTAVAGVVSAQPGFILGRESDSKAKIATLGRVRVRVDATRTSVHVGDLLVTSDRPGMAMVSQPLDLGGVKIHRPGTLIGKALEPLPSGEGEILVLLSLQ